MPARRPRFGGTLSTVKWKVHPMSEPVSLSVPRSRGLDRLTPQEKESLRSESRNAVAELQRLIAEDAIASTSTSTPLDIYRPLSSDWTPDLCLTTHLLQLDEQTANYHRYLVELAPAIGRSSDGPPG